MGDYLEVPLSALVPNPDNPRETLGDLDELAASIGAIGVLQRLLVTPTDPTEDGDGRWMVVDGHRRYWSARSIDYQRPVPVEVRIMDRIDRLAAAVAAGSFARPISPIDQAKAFRALADLGLNQVQIAERTGCPQPMISTRLRLLELTPQQQTMIHDGRMTLHQAKLATYELGRRAPDKAPRPPRVEQLARTRKPAPATAPDGAVCEACGQPLPERDATSTLRTRFSSHRQPLAEPISRAEALKLIEDRS